MDKRGAANGNTIFMVFVAGAIVWLLYGTVGLPFLGATKGSAGTGDTGKVITVDVKGQVCPVDSTVLTLGPVEDFYSPSAKLTGYYHRWYLKAKGNDNWVDEGTAVDGTTKTVSPGDHIQVYYNLNGSSTAHYPTKTEFEVPCVGSYTAATADTIYKDAYRLYNMTRAADVSSTIWNQNAVVNSASAPQSLTAGQVKKMKFELQFPNKEAFGAPGAKVLGICAWNSTYFSDFTLVSGKAKYTGSLPQRITVPAGFTVSAYEWDALSSNGIISDTAVVNADSTVPTTSTNQNINCTFVDGSWFKHTDQNLPVIGYETDRHVDVGSVDLSLLFRTNGTG